jgi:uncharacterized cupin superfamily protein
VGGKIVAGIEGIFGGEVTAYTSECETSEILQGTATVFAAYGTAVIAKPKEK